MAVSPVFLNKIFKEEYALDTSGLKLHVYRIYEFASSGALLGDKRNIPEYKEALSENDTYILSKGAYIVRYKEYVRIPENMIALTIPRSSLLRMGATIHTAVWDSGYEGQGIGLLVVFNENGIQLSKGTHVAQLVFFKVFGKSLTYEGIYKGERDQY